MTNDEIIQSLSKKMTVKLRYARELKHIPANKPNKVRLVELASEIRKNLEEPSLETAAHAHAGL